MMNDAVEVKGYTVRKGGPVDEIATASKVLAGGGSDNFRLNPGSLDRKVCLGAESDDNYITLRFHWDAENGTASFKSIVGGRLNGEYPRGEELLNRGEPTEHPLWKKLTEAGFSFEDLKTPDAGLLRALGNIELQDKLRFNCRAFEPSHVNWKMGRILEYIRSLQSHGAEIENPDAIKELADSLIAEGQRLNTQLDKSPRQNDGPGGFINNNLRPVHELTDALSNREDMTEIRGAVFILRSPDSNEDHIRLLDPFFQ